MYVPLVAALKLKLLYVVLSWYSRLFPFGSVARKLMSFPDPPETDKVPDIISPSLRGIVTCWLLPAVTVNV